MYTYQDRVSLTPFLVQVTDSMYMSADFFNVFL